MHIWILPCRPDTTVYMTEVEHNVGAFVSAIFAQPHVSLPAKTCMLAPDYVSHEQALSMWVAAKKGRRARYVQCSPEEWEGLWGEAGKELWRQFRLNEVVPDWGVGEVVRAKELGIEGSLVGLREALEQDARHEM